MNLVFIDGPEETLLGLEDIADIIVDLGSSEVLSSGQIRVAAYATDRAIEEIQTQGAVVTVVFDNDALQARTDVLFPPNVA